MSIYAVNKVCYRVTHDPALRVALSGPETERARALDEASPPLTDEERQAFLAGDVGKLSRMGANHFLLHQLGRWNLLGLDLPSYAERIRDEYRTERANWGLSTYETS